MLSLDTLFNNVSRGTWRFVHQEKKIAAPMPWCRYGIRDPSVLSSPDGIPVRDNSGNICIFFNGRDDSLKNNGATRVGLIRGKLGEEWSFEERPVFEDGVYTAQGSVIRLTPRRFHMYYSRNTKKGFHLALSNDGQNWRRESEKAILNPEPYGVTSMGLPFVRRHKNLWFMCFEGILNGRFSIFTALSPDGITWEPGNSGKPIYEAAENTWDSFGQANPSLYIDTDASGNASYMILYNGCPEQSAWSIGALFAKSLKGPWRSLPGPLLDRRDILEWKEGRIEGARLILEPEKAGIVFFGVPTQDSYLGGKIGFANLEAVSEGERDDGFAAQNVNAERVYNARLAKKYFKIWDTFPIQQFENQIEHQRIDSLISPGSKVLVLGCGGGRELAALLDRQCRITAVDISPDMIAIGKKRYPDAPINWVEADLHDLPQNLAGFDAALALGSVFNYLREPVRALCCIRRALKPGGLLFMAVINACHPTESGARVVYGNGQVRFLYNSSSLDKILSATGFEEITTEGIRFFVDMLPKKWNQEDAPADAADIMRHLLAVEEKLVKRLPPNQGKILLVTAISKK